MPNPTDQYQSKTGFIYFWGRIKTIFATKTELSDGLDDKVSKVTGKGLSTEDYTTEEKTKLSDIETGAEANDIDTISVNGTNQTITNKNVDITVPTKTSDITNDSGFQTASQVSDAIDNALSGITGIDFNFDYSSVDDLPATGAAGTIYFIPNGASESGNTYDEYVWVSSSSSYEKIGSATIDTSSFWTMNNLTAITTAEIDNILAN